MSKAKILFVLVALAVVATITYRSCGKEEAIVEGKKIRRSAEEKTPPTATEEANEIPEELAEVAERGETQPVEEGEVEPPPAPQPVAHPLKGGFQQIQNGELPEAEELFTEHVRLYPLDPEGHFGLGVVYRMEESFEQSVEEFAKTLLLDPGHLRAKYQAAEMLTFQMKGDYETAELLYQEILEEVPEERSAINGLASVYLSTGRADEAISLWEDLRTEMPDQPGLAKNLAEAYFIKGNQLTEAGDSGAAAEWVSKAMELNPGDPVYEAKWQELEEGK